MSEAITGNTLRWTYSEQSRIGDHIWWVSDISRFQRDYPDYKLSFDIRAILEEVYENGRRRWLKAS
jgi:CDP-paratose 2-epimerase